VRGKIEAEFADIGELRLKNIPRPLRVYRIGPAAPEQPAGPPTALSLPDKPSIAVLPFANMSGDPEQAALCWSCQYEAVLDAARQVIRSRPNHPPLYRWLAAALGQLGRKEEAKAALEKAVAIGGASFDMYVRNRAPWWRPESYTHMLEGLRKAGWQS
jgi:hypothetical protein